MPADISQPVLRYHQEVVNARQLDILDELFTPDFINEATGFPPIIGVQAMREVVQSILEGFSDCQSTIEDMMAIDDKVIVRWSISGTHHGVFQHIPPTGKRVHIGGIHIDLIKQQKIVKRWAYNSFPVLIQQLKG
jgi:predicted ester cyclase